MAVVNTTEIDHVLDGLLDDADEMVAELLAQYAVVLSEYVLAYSPQWSGDLVAQWHLAPGTRRMGYKMSRYKHGGDWQWHIGKTAGGAQREPFHPVRKPNVFSMDATAARMNTQLEAIRKLPPAQVIAQGISLFNAHPHAAELLGPTGFSPMTARARDPRAVPVLDAAVAFAIGKLASLGPAGIRRALASRRVIQARRLVRNAGAAGRYEKPKERHMAMDMRARALAERNASIRSAKADQARTVRDLTRREAQLRAVGRQRLLKGFERVDPTRKEQEAWDRSAKMRREVLRDSDRKSLMMEVNRLQRLVGMRDAGLKAAMEKSYGGRDRATGQAIRREAKALYGKSYRFQVKGRKRNAK